MIRLTLAQATEFILQKNHLVASRAASVGQLVTELTGLPHLGLTPFLAAHTRLYDFSVEALQQQTDQQGRFISGWLMNNTPYLVALADFVPLYVATARQRRQHFNAQFRLWGIKNAAIDRLAEQVVAIIGQQPLTMAEIATELPADTVQELTQTSRGGRVSRTTNLALVLRWLVAEGKLYARPTFSSNEQERRYAPLTYWYPDLDLVDDAPSEAEAQVALVRRYLQAFGPATEADISFWTGFGKSETARATGKLMAETSMTLVEGLPGMTLLLKSQAEAARATMPPDIPRLSILPANDPFLIAHRASRSRYSDNQKLQRKLFNSKGEAQPAILLDGKVVALWQRTATRRFTWQPLTQLDEHLSGLIDTRMHQLEQLYAYVDDA